MNNQSFSKVWIIVILVVLVAGGILARQYFGIPKEEVKPPTEEVREVAEIRVVPDVSYQVANGSVLISFPRLGVSIYLEPGWRIFTLSNLPTDVNKEKFREAFYSDQYGVPWFHIPWTYSDTPLTPLPFVHYTLVSPRRWHEITQIPGDQLGQFGAMGMSPTISELLQEIDVVVFRKERGQSLEQFMTMVDDRRYLDAKKAFEEGHLQSEPKREEEELFGRFKKREIISTVSPNIQSLLLSQPLEPIPHGAELFLLFGCIPGDKVIVVSKGRFSSININYIELFHSLSQKFEFKENFCDKSF